MRSRSFTYLEAFVVLAGVRMHLRLFGMGRSLARARGRAARSVWRDAAGGAGVEQALRCVTGAAAFFPGRAICLEQSIALFHLLCRAGIRSELVVGAQAYPFGAHAWVEVEGVPVGEDPERVRLLAPMVRVC